MRHFRGSNHFLPRHDEEQIKVTPVAAEEVIDNATVAESSMSANVLNTTDDTNNSFITKIRSNVSRVISKLFSPSGQSAGRSVEENRKRKATPEKLSCATIKRSRLNVPAPDDEGTSHHLYCSTPTTKHQTSNSIKSSSNASKRAAKQTRREHYFRAFNAKDRPRRIVTGPPKLSATDLIRFDIRSRAALGAAAADRKKDAVKKCYENKEEESDEESYFTAPTANYHSSGEDSDQGSVPATTSDFSANNEDKIRESDENSNITIPSSIANFDETQSDHRSSVGGNSSSYHCEFRSTEAKPFESDGSGRLTTFLGNSCYRQIQHARETSGDLFFGMYYERKKMLFASKNNQPASLTGYRPASKSSIFGSTSSLSAPSGNFGNGGNSGSIRGLRSKSMLLRSPFYEGMTRYGGASAAPYNTARESVFNLARSSRASSTSLPTARGQAGHPSTPSLRSQRILKVHEEWSSPLSEARKLAAAVKQSACSNRLEMRSWSSIDENTRRSSANPYTRPVMPLNELVIPSVPRMLQLKRLQKTTETECESTEHTIEDASSSILAAVADYGEQTSDTSEAVPMSACIATVPKKQVTKIKTKITRVHSNTTSADGDLFAPAEQLELPNDPLPGFASIPKIDLSLAFGSCANESKPILGKGSQTTCCDETFLSQTPQHTLKNQFEASLPFMFAAPEVLGFHRNLAVANSITFRFATPERLYFEATNDSKNGNTFDELMSSKQSNWECSTCLIRNENVNICIACSSPKPISRTSKTEVATSETTQPVTDKNFNSIIGVQSARWECPDCFVRNDSSQQLCVCCGAAKKENQKTIAALGTIEQRSSTIQGSSPTKTSADGFKTLVMQQKSCTWECSTCLTRNNNHSVQCVCCNQLKPDSSMSGKSNSNLITAQHNSANCTNLHNENYNSKGIGTIPNAPPFSSVVAVQKNNQKGVNENDVRDTSFKPEASGMKGTQHPIVEPHSFPVSEFTIDVPSTTAVDVDTSTNNSFIDSSSTLIGTIEHQTQSIEPASFPTLTNAVTGGTEVFSSPYTMPSDSDVVSFNPIPASEKSPTSNAAYVGTTINSTTFSNATSKTTSTFNFHLNGNSGDIMMADDESNGERNSIPLDSASKTNSTILAFPFASVMKNSYANETDVAFNEVGIVSQMQIPSLPTSLSTTKQSGAPAGSLFIQQDMPTMPQSSLVNNRITSFPTAEIRTLESHQALSSFNFGSQVPVSIQSQTVPPTSAISSSFGETALPTVMAGTDNRIIFGASNKTIETPLFSSAEIKPVPPPNNGGSFVFSSTNVGNKRPSDNTMSGSLVDMNSHQVTPVPYIMPLLSDTTASNSFASGKGASAPVFQFGDPSFQNPFVPPAIGRGLQQQQQIVQRRLKLRATRRLHQR
ncbi:nuclear pore complex protein Nup153 isoform X2 [Anopheles bellator]|uniref:nuclear pore complex protein Nup153 isoform X2 n=1 Tax=Anopheles bellator TaxID=139047 RepID=UPI002647E58D|nr:nuclear pore complex protein Nup153 isoform X2 [Anopheles bellator]